MGRLMVDYSLVNVAEETSIGDLSILGLCGLSALANMSMEKTPYNDWSRLKLWQEGDNPQ